MSKSPSPRGRQRSKSRNAGTNSRSRSKSPDGSSSFAPFRKEPESNPNSKSNLEAAFVKMLTRGFDGENEKAFKIPTFSDGTDWEAVVFELEIDLEKFWKHKSELDIIEYLNGSPMICDDSYIKKAEKMIYHALTTDKKGKVSLEKQSWPQNTKMRYQKSQEMKD